MDYYSSLDTLSDISLNTDLQAKLYKITKLFIVHYKNKKDKRSEIDCKMGKLITNTIFVRN